MDSSLVVICKGNEKKWKKKRKTEIFDKFNLISIKVVCFC